MNRTREWLLLAMVALVAGCGSDSPTEPGDNGPSNGNMTASIDESLWSASIITPAMAALGSGGFSALGGANQSHAIAFAWLDEGVGTYQVGVSVGANGNLSEVGGPGGWLATSAQGSGTIVITVRTDTRVAGTFQFEMPPSPTGSSTDTRLITNGQFDVDL